jgi:FdhD protein
LSHAHDDAPLPAPATTRAVSWRDDHGGVHEASWGIAVESPVQILLNGEPWTVLLATPSHLDDLAVGLAVTERVLPDTGNVQAVQVASYLGDVSVNLVAPATAFDVRARQARTLVSGTACGLCGLESLSDLQARLQPRVQAGRTREAIADDVVLAAFAALPALQPLNAATRSMHAAAWCAPDGRILLVREDVGRHNALDKLVGALAQSQRLADGGFIIMSSRCSYELVAKSACTGAQLLATVSAPTSMALTWSEALGVPLACCVTARGGASHLVRFPSLSAAGR